VITNSTVVPTGEILAESRNPTASDQLQLPSYNMYPSTPSRPRQPVLSNEFPHFESQNPSAPTEISKSAAPNGMTNTSQLELKCYYSAPPALPPALPKIVEISFRDARDKNYLHPKYIYPLLLQHQVHRVAAAMSMLCHETVDQLGKLIRPEFASQLCELLLGDMDMYRALSFSNTLYSTYGMTEDAGKYLQKGCEELRNWYQRNGKMTSKDNSGNVIFRDCKPRFKRTIESENTIKPSVESDVINVEPPVKRYRPLPSNQTLDARPVVPVDTQPFLPPNNLPPSAPFQQPSSVYYHAPIWRNTGDFQSTAPANTTGFPSSSYLLLANRH
jgi:hypothetical protein